MNRTYFGRLRLSGVITILLLAVASVATGHDGGFGHSRRTLYFTVEGDRLVLEYRIQQNREDALVEMTRMDTDGDGTVSTAERDRFLKDRAKELADNLQVKTAAGEAVALTFERARLDQGLTQTFRFQLATTALEVLLEDRNFSHKPGLVLVRNSAGLTVTLARPTDLTHAERVSLRVRREERKR
jgi:hypothetical protein